MISELQDSHQSVSSPYNTQIAQKGYKSRLFTSLGNKFLQTHRHREQLCGCQVGELGREGRIGSLGLADVN